jgi:hypothetical protein
MKRIVFPFIFVILISAPLSAQGVVDSFLEKHGGDDALRLISIGKKMLDKMEEQSLGTPELLEAIKGLDNIRIITSEDQALKEEYYHSAHLILSKNKNFTELSSIDEENLQLIVKMKEVKGVVNELIILSLDSKGFNLTSLMGGNINLEVLAAYSAPMDFIKLEKINDFEN